MTKILLRLVTSSFTRIIGLGLNFLMVLVIGEFLDANLSSNFFQIQSFVLILLSVIRFGSEDYLLRKSSSTEGKFKPSLTRTKGFYVRTLLTSLLLFSGVYFYFDLHLIEACIISLYGVLYNYGLYLSVLYQGAKQYNRASLTFFIFPPLLIIISVISGLTESLSMIYLISIIGIICGLLFTRFTQSKVTNSVPFSLPKIFSNPSLGISNIGGEIMRSAPILLSKVSLSPEETVTWTYSIKLVQFSSIFILLLNYYYAPKIRESFLLKGKLGVNIIFKEQVKLSIIAGLGFVLVYVLFYFLFDSEILGVIGLLLPGYILSLVFASIGYILIMMDKEIVNAAVGGIVILFYLIAFTFMKDQSIYVLSIVVSVGVFLPKVISFIYYKYVL